MSRTFRTSTGAYEQMRLRFFSFMLPVGIKIWDIIDMQRSGRTSGQRTSRTLINVLLLVIVLFTIVTHYTDFV
ncbi:MAG: hypothetical protein EOO08_09110 [Chitinophagaceae bacterium]|nr:MAG: hypothetical protein EOO08_09110 [Chitinophagaceae bacterium]